MTGTQVNRMQEHYSVDKLDRFFQTMFVIVSVFNVGLILSTAVRMGETSPAANSGAITQGMIPIMTLVIVWWAAEFYDKLSLKIVGWFILFILVFYSIMFLFIMLGVDRYLGFDVMYLVYLYILTPLPSAVVAWKVKTRYCSVLNRPLTNHEKWTSALLILLFAGYWFVVPWDPTVFGLPWWL